jgi:ribonuclease HII
LAKRLESLKSGPPERSNRRSAESPEELLRRLEAFDRDHLRVGPGYLAGVDEAGRGALAGPVVAAAVVLPAGADLLGVNDSKKVSEAQREFLFAEIVKTALSIGIGVGNPDLIDSRNILNATLAAMARAIDNLRMAPSLVLVDGRDAVECPFPVVPVVGGDARSLSVAAASIVAKVTRDRVMRRLHRRYPLYNFLENKGYGTPEHLEAIARHGVIPEHRKSYRLKSVEKTLRLF